MQRGHLPILNKCLKKNLALLVSIIKCWEDRHPSHLRSAVGVIWRGERMEGSIGVDRLWVGKEGIDKEVEEKTIGSRFSIFTHRIFIF